MLEPLVRIATDTIVTNSDFLVLKGYTVQKLQKVLSPPKSNLIIEKIK